VTDTAFTSLRAKHPYKIEDRSTALQILIAAIAVTVAVFAWQSSDDAPASPHPAATKSPPASRAISFAALIEDAQRRDLKGDRQMANSLYNELVRHSRHQGLSEAQRITLLANSVEFYLRGQELTIDQLHRFLLGALDNVQQALRAVYRQVWNATQTSGQSVARIDALIQHRPVSKPVPKQPPLPPAATRPLTDLTSGDILPAGVYVESTSTSIGYRVSGYADSNAIIAAYLYSPYPSILDYIG
jgi:hypothetical protein